MTAAGTTTGAAKERNEAELIARILGGEKELFHDLFRPYERMLYLTAFWLVRNERTAGGGGKDAVVNRYRILPNFREIWRFTTCLVTLFLIEPGQNLRRPKR